MSASRLAVALVVVVAIAGIAAACELGDGSCLRMSDCDPGYACVEGTCRSDHALPPPEDAPPAGDAGVAADGSPDA